MTDTTTMRAVHVREPGGPDAVRVEELPVPRPTPGEALASSPGSTCWRRAG